MAWNALKWWKINTTGLYPAPRDLISTHSSLLASHGTMTTPDCSYGSPEGQEEATSRSWPVITGHVQHWNLIVHSCSLVFVWKKLHFLSWAIRPLLSDLVTYYIIFFTVQKSYWLWCTGVIMVAVQIAGLVQNLIQNSSVACYRKQQVANTNQIAFYSILLALYSIFPIFWCLFWRYHG